MKQECTHLSSMSSAVTFAETAHSAFLAFHLTVAVTQVCC